MRILSLVCLIVTSLGLMGCQSLRRDRDAELDFAQTTGEVAEATVSATTSDVATVSYEEEFFVGERAKPDPLSTEAIGNTLKSAMGKGPNQTAAKTLFDEADSVFETAVRARQAGEKETTFKKDFRRAGDLYLRAAERLPNSSIEQDSLFQAGEAFFFADSYDKANDAYEKLIQKYSGSRLMDRAEARRFAIAQYWSELQELNPDHLWTYNFTNRERPARDTGGHARRVFNNIRLEDPTGKLADDATLALGNAYFRNKAYLDAADSYEDLRKAYPGSPHLFNATVLEIQSRLRAYRGPAYDGMGIEKANRLMEALVAQFPEQVEDQRTALDELAAEIRYELAARELYLAKLYDRRNENRAARLYYGKIVSKFSDTVLAKEASERLAELRDEPDLPPQKLKWLVDALPKPKDDQPLFNNDVPRQ